MIGEALAYRGHRLAPRYFPLARVPLAFRQGEVQAAMTDLGQDLSTQGAHYGEPAVLYRNVLVSLQGRRLKIEKPEDLQGLSIVAFQGAAKRYPEWLAASEAAGLYFEQNNQELQVLGLNKGRYDVVLSDQRIYQYFEQLLERTSLFKAKAVVFHPSSKKTRRTTGRCFARSRSATISTPACATSRPAGATRPSTTAT